MCFSKYVYRCGFVEKLSRPIPCPKVQSRMKSSDYWNYCDEEKKPLYLKYPCKADQCQFLMRFGHLIQKWSCCFCSGWNDGVTSCHCKKEDSSTTGGFCGWEKVVRCRIFMIYLFDVWLIISSRHLKVFFCPANSTWKCEVCGTVNEDRVRCKGWDVQMGVLCPGVWSEKSAIPGCVFDEDAPMKPGYEGCKRYHLTWFELGWMKLWWWIDDGHLDFKNWKSR
jgi:hypothetical protein